MELDKPYTIGIIGVRDFKGELYVNDKYITETLVQHIVKNIGTETKFRFVTGGGKGVESMVVNWAQKNQIDCRKIPPNIREFGPTKAFSVRNNHIVTQCDELLVFWDGCIDIITESIITSMHLGKRATVFPVI